MTLPSRDKAFFSRCVEEHMNALFGVAFRLTGKSEDAEDLVAESVARAWSAFGTLEDRSRFRPWVFRILRNCYISDYRKKSIRPTEAVYDELADGNEDPDVCSMLMDESEEFLNWWSNPEHEFFNNILGEEIMAAIGRLPESFRVTILMINVEGLTYDEAAEALGVPAGTVRSRMKRGRTLLQKALWMQAMEAGFAARREESNP
jgi:RNA polymerase sigma-70 factor (ECF subfamily)